MVGTGRFAAPPPAFDNHNPLTRSAPSALARKKMHTIILQGHLIFKKILALYG